MIQADGTAPYAPPKTVIDLIHRFRDKGLTTPFDLGVLDRAGISSGLAPRVLQALKLLDLIDAAGNPTDALESLRRAPSSEFQAILAEVVRSAYADVFYFVDPSEDSTEAISDAFRSYNPPGQRDRMVTLFLGLCKEAGIIEGKPAPRTSTNGRPARQTAEAKPRRSPTRPSTRGKLQQGLGSTPLPPQLEGLLKTLPNPPEDGWTSARRDQFIAAWKATIDYTYPIREQLPPGDESSAETGGQI